MISSAFNLRFKFIIGLVLFALALGLCISVIMYFHFNSIMESEISQRSRLLLAQSDAVQNYVKTELRPVMFNTLPEGRFIIQAMSTSYIARQVMARLNVQDASRYHFRRVSIKPRNPMSSPDEFESGLISLFNGNRQLKIWEQNTRVGDTQYHLVARPVTFIESCMQCHGEPDDAPDELLDLYGDKNGFHYTVNEVGGVVVAGFPVDMIKGPAKELTLRYLSLYLMGILCFAGLISLFFDQLVMKNLHHLTQIFKTRFSGEQEQRIIERLGQKDEIEGLVEGVDELALWLAQAQKKLEDYALNLEKKVEERTQALDLKAKKHLGDVRLFVDLLSGFSGSPDTKALISKLLHCVGERYQAHQVIYHCTVVSENAYAWKKEDQPPPLSQEIKDLLWKEEILFKDQHLYIPVKSLESHWGILNLSWTLPPDFGDLDPATLLALGQQVAILIENIHAVSNIRLQHEMLDSIFKGISDPLLLIDEECHILIANAGSQQILKQEKKSDREEALKDFLNQGPDPGPSPNILGQVIQTRQPVNQEIITRDNQHFKIDLYPLPSQGQGRMRIVVYARNITREKQMMARMHQAEQLSAIGKMAAGIAHEINNPLGVIQCYADLVKDAVEDDPVRQDIEVILKHTRSAKKVVQDLLNLSRSKKTISGACDINLVIDSALEVFKTQAGSRQIQVTTDFGEALPPIQCDAAVLEQILTNLWLNAMDALPENGEIILSTCQTDPGFVRLSVEDNGPGIPDRVLPRIFDPFYTTKEVGKGTGLGLSLVHGFVHEIGGRIEVDNTIATRFNVYFPIARAGS